MATYLGSISLDLLWYAFVIAETVGLLLAVFYYRNVYKNTLQTWQEL
jgi:hypothetical protein